MFFTGFYLLQFGDQVISIARAPLEWVDRLPRYQDWIYSDHRPGDPSILVFEEDD
jgi:hypothetical protein